MRKRPRSDLPLYDDPSNRVIPWILGLMIYVASLSVVLAMLITGMLSHWRDELIGVLTVQIYPSEQEQDSVAMGQQISTALEIIRDQPEVATAHALDIGEIKTLLTPWIDKELLEEAGVSFPQIIDVRLNKGMTLDTRVLLESLEEQVSNIEVTGNADWLEGFVDVAVGLRATALAILGLVALACASVMLLTTRSILVGHLDTIELLVLMGARDSYIRRQCQAHAWRLGLFGGTIGLLLTIMTFVGLLLTTSAPTLILLPGMEIGFLEGVAVLALIPLVAGLCMMGARFATAGILSRLQDRHDEGHRL